MTSSSLSREAFIAEAWDIFGKKWDKRAKLEVLGAETAIGAFGAAGVANFLITA
jgi:hypothetical protein